MFRRGAVEITGLLGWHMVSLGDSRQFVLISKLKMPNESVEILIPEDETTALSRNAGHQTHSNMAPRNSQKNG